MTPRKGRGGRANNSSNHSRSHSNNNNQLAQYPPVSDYDTNDNSNNNTYYDTIPQQQPQQQESPPPPRSNEELNISVLRRHNPAITSILSLAPYVVVYTFSPATQQWEKNGIEGTMFICQLTQGSYGEERYSVFVLNRRGLNNFDILLTDGDNVEITDEFVILKADQEGGISGINNSSNINNNNNNKSSHIIGLWIFSEPAPNSTAETRKINAEVIKECATHAGRSMELARATTQQQQAYSSVPMGRQISLKELFGQQRAQDDGIPHTPTGSSSNGAEMLPNGGGAPPADQLPTSTAQGNVLTDLFRRAGLVNPS